MSLLGDADLRLENAEHRLGIPSLYSEMNVAVDCFIVPESYSTCAEHELSPRERNDAKIRNKINQRQADDSLSA